MTIEVSEFPRPLLELLFVRHAWDLDVWVHFDELDPAPDPGASRRPSEVNSAELSERWVDAWKACSYWNWRSRRDYADDPSIAAMHGVTGPVWWSRTFGWDGLDRIAFEGWCAELESLRQPDGPERAVGDELVAAWRDGLRAVFVMPYLRTEGAEWNGSRFMTISARTRLDPGAYRDALTGRPRPAVAI
jgi:hypothetical protein